MNSVRKVVPFLLALAAFTASPIVSSVWAQDDPPAKPVGPAVDGDYTGYWLPPNVSNTPQAAGVDNLINWIHVFMVILFVGWGVFFLYCLFKFRARPGHTASYSQIKAKPAKYAEIVVAGVEAVLLLGFSVPIWAQVKNDIPGEDENPIHVRVVGQQFQWNFHYPGPDGKFGRTRPDYVDPAANILGIDPNDPAGVDDVFSPELHFPKMRPVICDISSKDVIHSFWLPVLRVKQDAIPGMTIPVWFEAKETGNYEVACAQLCGNNHYSMRALMTIHADDAEYEQWLADQAPEEFDEDEFD
ncbi:MAG: cytochrome c oxidase subunit II [Phycisphaerae bacterium]